MRNGFYVEVGGNDGEELSNTIYFERKLGWKGLLIEPEPVVHKLLKKRRNAWVVPVCLSPTSRATWVRFRPENTLSRIVDGNDAGGGDVEIQCLPIYSILLALNVTRIDYFSLDVEGADFQVLQTIPFDKIYIKCITIEWNKIQGGIEVVDNFLFPKGYRHLNDDEFPTGWTEHDVIYVRDDL